MSTVKTGIPLHAMPNILNVCLHSPVQQLSFYTQKWDWPGGAGICYKLLELLKDRPLIFKIIYILPLFAYLCLICSN